MNVKMKKRKNKSKKIIVFIALVALVVGGTATYYYLSQQDKSPKSNTSSQDSPKSKQKPAKQIETESKDGESNNTSHESEKNITPSYSGESAHNSPSLTGTVSYRAVIGGNLSIRTNIDQLVSGKCHLKLSNGQRVLNRESAIAQNPSSSTCEGFDIPISELGGGNWQIDIQISGGGKTGTLRDGMTI